jgi:integrase
MDSKNRRTPGIETRHSKACASRAGAACDCTPTYRAHVWDARANRRVRRTFKRLSEAKTWRRDAAAAVAHGDLAAPGRTPRLADALAELLDGMRTGAVLTRSSTLFKPGTIRTYAYAVEKLWAPELGHLRVHEVHRRDLQRLVDRMRAEGRSPSSISGRLDPLRVLYRRAVRDELVRSDPTEHLDLPAIRHKPIDVTTVEDPARLLAALDEQDRALWATALYAGLRRGELRALRWSDVDLERNLIRVARGWDDVEGEQDTKTIAGVRPVPIVEALRAELVRHKLATGRGGDDLIFGRTATSAFSTSSVDRRAKDAWDAAGLRRPTLHTGRHGTISRLIEAGISAKAIQVYAGHSSITTTFDRYGHLFPSTIDDDRRRLDEHLRAGAAGRSRGTMAGQSQPETTGPDGS